MIIWRDDNYWGGGSFQLSTTKLITCRNVSQFSANDSGIIVIPSCETNSTPYIVSAYFHTTLLWVSAIYKSAISLMTAYIVRWIEVRNYKGTVLRGAKPSWLGVVTFGRKK